MSPGALTAYSLEALDHTDETTQKRTIERLIHGAEHMREKQLDKMFFQL